MHVFRSRAGRRWTVPLNARTGETLFVSFYCYSSFFIETKRKTKIKLPCFKKKPCCCCCYKVIYWLDRLPTVKIRWTCLKSGRQLPRMRIVE